MPTPKAIRISTGRCGAAGATSGSSRISSIELHPLGPIVYGGYLGWTPRPGQGGVRGAARRDRGRSRRAPARVHLATAPDDRADPARPDGQPVVLLAITWLDNDPEAGERAIAPFREKVAPAVELVRQVPVRDAAGAVDALSPHGRRSYTYAGYFAEASDELVDMVVGSPGRVPGQHLADGRAVPDGRRSGARAEGRDPGEPRSATRVVLHHRRVVVGSRTTTRSSTGSAASTRLRDSSVCRAATSTSSPTTTPRARGVARRRDVGASRRGQGKVDPDNVFARNPNKRAAAVPA